MLSKEETEHIAKLARLELNDAEIAKYQKDLVAILGYIDKLKEVDIKNVAPFTHSVDLADVTRADEAAARPQESTAKLKAAFPEKQGDYLKVKPIF